MSKEKEIKARRSEIVTESKTNDGRPTYAFFRDRGIESPDYEGSFVAVLSYASGRIENEAVVKMLRAIVHDSIYRFSHLEVGIDSSRSLLLDDGTEIIFRSGGRGSKNRILVEVKKHESMLAGKVAYKKLFSIRPEEDGTASIEEVAQCVFTGQFGRADWVFESEGYCDYLADPGALIGVENPELAGEVRKVSSVGYDTYLGSDLAKLFADLYEMYRIESL